MFLNNFPILIILIFYSLSALGSVPENPLSEKDQKCQEVFNKLKAVHGILPSEPPKLQLVKRLPDKRFVLAMANNQTKEIFIEERTFDMCNDSLGVHAESGLAYILAHELGHFTRKHNVRHQFIEKFKQDLVDDAGFQALAVSSADEASEEHVHNILTNMRKAERSHQIRRAEAEADLDAGFTCYLAGYNTKVAGPLFLDKAYARFNINPEGGDYASKEERKLILEQTGKSLDTLINVFETGTYLDMGGFNNSALQCYEYVLNRYGTKELHNNIGVFHLNHFARNLSAGETKYMLPIGIDLSPFTVIPSSDSIIDENGMTEEELRAIEEMLRSEMNEVLEPAFAAIDHFDKAIELDENYYSAMLNKSIAYIYIHFIKVHHESIENYRGDDLQFALVEALKAKQVLEVHKREDKKGYADGLNLLAVIYRYLDQIELSDMYIDKALAKDPENHYALINKEVFLTNNGDLTSNLIKEKFNTQGPCQEEGTIFGDQNFGDLEQKIGNDWNTTFVISRKKGLIPTDVVVRYFKGENFEIYQIAEQKIEDISGAISFFKPLEGYDFPTSCMIKKDMLEEVVLQNYGKPFKTINSTTGTVLQYQSVLFMIDAGKKVENYILQF